MKTAIYGQFEPTFYKNIDLDDMLNYLLNIRKFQSHNAKSLVNYFHRYRDIFFGHASHKNLIGGRPVAPGKGSYVVSNHDMSEYIIFFRIYQLL
jgi:hypothetical protein